QEDQQPDQAEPARAAADREPARRPAAADVRDLSGVERGPAAEAHSLGGVAVVTRLSSRRDVAAATSATARSNGSWFACDGFCMPLTLRTNWTAAAWISSSVVGGSKLR